MLGRWCLFVLFLIVCVQLWSCSSSQRRNDPATEQNIGTESGNKTKKHDRDDKGEQSTAKTDDSAKCDASLWDRVYNPERLEVHEQCKVVTGVIEERNADEDGDEHMLLKLDPGQEDLLTKKNLKKKNGDLVIEAVCVNPPTLKKVGSTCDGFVNKVQLPNVGDHVRVTGSYVNDTHNGWTEIHPITRIEIVN